MKPDRKMPTPWCDPDSGIYYLNLRIPTDLLAIYHPQKHKLKSLRTKNRKEAERKCCEEWLIFQREFERHRRNLATDAELTEEIIPHLMDEWLHKAIRDDEAARLTGAKARTDLDMASVLLDFIEDLRRGQRTGQHPEWLQVKAAGLLRDKNIRFDTRSLPYAKYVEELSRAYVRLLDVQSSRDYGEHIPSPPAPKEVLLLSQLYAKFKAYSIGEKRWKNPEAQDSREYSPIVRDFIALVGDKPVHSLTIADAQQYYERTMARRDISLGTKKRNLTRIKTVLLYGKSKHQVPDVTAPLAISTSYKKTHQSYERFNKDDLEALFHSEVYRNGSFKKASQYWLPLLGLYTGARLDEPASLLVTDIKEVQGVWCFYMSSEEANGGGKNDYAPRLVPMHPEIKKAGFLSYWKTIKDEGYVRLFPELGEASRDGCSKRATVDFTDYRRSVGVGAMVLRSSKAFHSFRSTLVSELAERGVDGELRRKIVGHSGKGDVHDVIYDQSGFDAIKMFQAVSKANFLLTHPAFVDTESMKAARLRHRDKKLRQKELSST